MRFALIKTRRARRVTTAAVGGTMALAIVGGSLLGATAANADTLSCLTTSGTTTLVNATGSGQGLINLGSPGGLIGVATGANGLQIGLLSCSAVVTVGGAAPGTTVATINTPATVPTTTPTTPVTTPTVPTTTDMTNDSSSNTSSNSSSSTSSNSSSSTSSDTSSTDSSTSGKVATVKVTTSTATVYPSAKGYKHSKVTFSVKGLTSVKGAVKITGKAVLRKGTKVVKTWKINSSTTKLSWNGKIGKKVKAGTYKLTVTAWSSDGTKKVSTMKVKVSSKHLVTRTLSAKTVNLAGAKTDTLPKAIRSAFKYGKVTLRITTVAEVTGKANLVITGPKKGQKLVIPLQDGTHTTKSAVLPKGFTSAKFKHDWKSEDATLIGLYTTFSYKALV